MRGCSTYFLGASEQFTNTMYSLMLLAYQHALELQNIQLESLFSWFFDNYLFEEFHVSGFIFNPPSKGSTDLEKCKILATEIDSVLKQFELYSHEGEIDRELFELNSDSLNFRNIPSLISNKYFYSSSNECVNCMNCLFSDQNTLAYTEHHEDKYTTFFELMSNEKVNLSDIHEYNIPLIDFLIKKKCVRITENSDIKFFDRKVTILHDLFKNQYCCTSYLQKYSDEIRDLFESHDIQYASTLFSNPEQDYLSYVLTKSDFSNGLDLRNKYVHGNYPNDPTQHGKDYLELLKVLIIIVIKLNEEFCLKNQIAVATNS